MKIRGLHTYLIAIFFLLSISVFGQMANYKSLYIYNFIKRIEWPVSETHPDTFYIIVYGESKTIEALEQIANTKKAGFKEIKVQQVFEISDIQFADLILVSYNKRKDLAYLSELIHFSPVLLVADYKNAEESDINFLETDDGLEFLIRPEAIRKKGLKLSDSLILLGKQEEE